MAKTVAKDKDGSNRPDRGDKPAKSPGAKGRGDKAKGGKPGSDKPVPAGDGVKGQVDTWVTSASRYLKAVRAEMKRITWPSRDQLRAYTIVVLLTLIFVTFYLWVCDLGFTWLFKKLLGQ